VVATRHGGALRLDGVVTDITADRRAEAERTRAEALRDGQNRVLETIAAGAPLADVLGALATFVEAQSEGMLCSVLLLDEDGARLRHGAAPSLPAEYNAAVDGLEIGPRAGSCGTAAFLGRQVIVRDILEDPLWDGYRALAAPFGAPRVLVDADPRARRRRARTFAMYYREPRSPDPDELRLIDIATHIAGIAIERERAERARKRLAALVESSDDAIVGTLARRCDHELERRRRADLRVGRAGDPGPARLAPRAPRQGARARRRAPRA